MEGDGRLPYLRGLDGLRGASVLLVLLFHGGVAGFGGGFLGVSVFFTLSGYLITQLLLQEHARTGRISLRAFWGRRLRRLAPASLLALLAIAAATLLTDAFPGRAVPGDVLAATFDIANWRFAAATTTYDDLFTAGPSPVLHFWSLAIEEQFYVLFPLLVVAVLARGGRRRLPLVLAGLALAGTAASIASPDDLAYYGTHARAPELLTGALLAVALPLRRSPLRAEPARALAAAGALAAIALGVLVATSTPTSAWLFQGGLPATSLLTAAVIGALTVPGPLRVAAEARPLVALGRVSYGAYVYHWPLFLVLSEERVGLTGTPLLAVRLAATLTVAAISYVVVEQPVRLQRVLPRPIRATASFATAVSAVAALVVVSAPAPLAPMVPELEGQAVALRSRPPVVDVLVVGTVDGLDEWVLASADGAVEVRVRSVAASGCPRRLGDRTVGLCRSLAAVVRDADPDAETDVVVLGLGPADRRDLEPQLARMAADPGSLEAAADGLAQGAALIDAVLAALPDVPVHVVDTGADDLLARQLRAADVRDDRLTVTRPPAGSFAADFRRLLPGLGGDRLRVLVVGDSTSFQLATALNAAGGDRLEVVWAGRQSCPLASALRTRWGPGIELDGAVCPSVGRGWPEAVAELQPDVVVAAASLASLAEHRYDDASGWVAPGDPAYVAAHDAAMADLQSLVARYGAVTLVATVPPLVEGQSFDGPVGEPARLAAWTAQIERWDRWQSVGTVDWAGIATTAEAQAGHHLRVDAVHFEPKALEELLAPRLVTEVVAAVERTRAQAAASGCRPAELPATLVLARCRPAASAP